MPLSSIIARVLALADAYLGYFVDLSPTTIAGNCYDFAVYNATVTECGRELLASEVLEEFIETIAKNGIIAGLFSVT